MSQPDYIPRQETFDAELFEIQEEAMTEVFQSVIALKNNEVQDDHRKEDTRKNNK